MSSPTPSTPTNEPSCPIPRFLSRSHPAHATPVHSSFENHHHIASFTVAFTDMNRRRGGAKPFRICFNVDTSSDIDGSQQQQHQVCFDGKLYAHKAFSNQYQHYQRGRFGCTMLTPELGYIVSGTVKNVEKDMVMMNMSAPHDTRHYWIQENVEINENTQLNMKHMQNPVYALSVGATYTVSFYSINRNTNAAYVATLTDHNSLAVSCEMLPYTTIPTAAAHSLAQARRKKPSKLTIPSPPSMGNVVRMKRHQSIDVHADMSHTPSSPASSESSGASSPSSSHQYSSDSTPSSPPSQLSRISSTSSSIASPDFIPTSSDDIHLKWNQLQYTRHLMSLATTSNNVALTFYTSAPIITDDINIDEIPKLKRKLSLEMMSHEDTDDMMIWPTSKRQCRSSVMDTSFDLDIDGIKTQPLFMSDVTTNNFYHDSDFLI